MNERGDAPWTCRRRLRVCAPPSCLAPCALCRNRHRQALSSYGGRLPRF